ncbi:MAG TPA: hypothetical protein VNB24_05325 [Acidimicrobiales bacterium]|nr:hypothetical protein [Acidimicrobiales bacterium]
MTAVDTGRISREDIESKLRQIKGDAEGAAEGARNVGVPAGAAVAVLLLVLIYLMGRRSGKKRSAYVAVRRL